MVSVQNTRDLFLGVCILCSSEASINIINVTWDKTATKTNIMANFWVKSDVILKTLSLKEKNPTAKK